MPLSRFIQSVRFQPGWLGIFVSPVFFLRRELNSFIKQQAPQMQGKVADIGCGTKPYQHYFTAAASYTGFDLAADQQADVVFDGKLIPATNGSFDNAISSEVLEHVFWPKEWLQEINRILKMDGLLLLTCPFMFQEHEAPHDYGRYSSYGLRHLLQQQGFEVIVFQKATTGLRCILLQWNVLWWTTFKKHLPRPTAFILSWFFFFPANLLGLLLGWCWKNT
ncbi:MAG: class I SAM-dependent methyltransferase, partial [Hymenobacter sp.]